LEGEGERGGREGAKERLIERDRKRLIMSSQYCLKTVFKT